MTKPATIPVWNTGGSNNTEPSSGQKIAGWATNAVPPSSFFNWMQKLYGEWLTWLDAFESTAHTWTALQTFDSMALSDLDAEAIDVGELTVTDELDATTATAVDLPKITTIAHADLLTVDGAGDDDPEAEAGWDASTEVHIWKDQMGDVHLEGAMQYDSGGGGGPNIFALPAGYRPVAPRTFLVAQLPAGAPALSGSATAIGVIVIGTDGMLVYVGGGGSPTDNDIFHLEQISFRAA